MYSKKIIAGYTLLVSGITTLICVFIFSFMGYKFFLNSDVKFENNKDLIQSENLSTEDTSIQDTIAQNTVNQNITNSVNSSQNSDVIFEEDQTLDETPTMSDSITIPGFDTWTIKANETRVTSNFYNPESNNCYFVITVTLNDTGEQIYQSNYLKPGQHLYKINLLKSMTSGTYNATLNYSTYSIDDFTPLNGADVPFKLIVE